MGNTGNMKKSKVRNPYTMSPVPGEATADNICSKFSGWNNLGMMEFNRVVKVLKKLRKHRLPMERELMEKWVAKYQAKMNKNGPMKRRRVEDDYVLAQNSLFDRDLVLEDEEEVSNPFAGLLKSDPPVQLAHV